MNGPPSTAERIAGLLGYLIGFILLALELVGLWVGFGRGFWNGFFALVLPPYAWILGGWQFWVWIFSPEMHS